MVDVIAILKEFEAVKSKRAPWEGIWELIAQYMLQRKRGFTSTMSPGAFYNHDDVYDNTAGQALHSMVSSLDGSLWKNGGRTFKIVKPIGASDSEENKKFYKEVNQRLISQIEHEKAGWGTARIEALTEGVAFGTDGIGVFKAPAGSEHKIEFKTMGLKSLWIVEDSKGRVIKEFFEIEFDAFQLVGEYGEVARTDKVKALIDGNNHDTKLKVLWVVRPRSDYQKKGEGLKKFSYESIHILQDEKVVLREAGYSGNSIIVSRFYKNEGEEQGTSPGYNALQPTIELNAVVEILTKGSELAILPSWYVLDNGTFSNGKIDRSPGSVITIDVTSSRITGMAPIGQIGTIGDMTPSLKLVEVLINEICGHFYIDKLTDLNNRTRMTLGEAQIRNELRADNVGSIFSRQLDEKLTPVIRRCINILEEDGELGVEFGSELYAQLIVQGKKPLEIPKEIMELRRQGVEIYRIQYISPAARILRSEELRGVISVWQFAAGFSQVSPELMLRIDKKRTMEVINELYGSPDDLLLSEDEYVVALDSYNKSQQMMMKLKMAMADADIKTKEASANQQNAQAEATTGGMNGLINGGGAGYSAMIM